MFTIIDAWFNNGKCKARTTKETFVLLEHSLNKENGMPNVQPSSSVNCLSFRFLFTVVMVSTE